MSQHHDLEAERAVLASVFLDEAAYDEVADRLAGEDFYSRGHAAVWSAMGRLRARPDHIDLVTVRSELAAHGELERIGGDDALLKLTDYVPTVDAIETYAARVVQLAAVRRFVLAALTIAGRAREPIEDIDAWLDAAEAEMQAVAMARRVDDRGTHIRQAVIEATEELMARAEGRGAYGVMSGLGALDGIVRGFKPGHLVILAGRPGMGKSAFAGHVTRAAAGGGEQSAVFSLEMPKWEWGQRFVITEGRVDNTRVRDASLSADQWKAWTEGAGAVANLPIHIDDTPALSVWALRSKARRVKAQAEREGRAMSLIVVDYLQLMRSGEKHQKRTDEVDAVSRALKALAKELDVAVLALAQLNRSVEQRPDKRPNLSDLRESGQIEQDADVILFMYRDGYYNPKDADPTELEIIVGKQRGGPTGTARCRFFASTYRFEDRANEREYGAGPADAPMPDPDDFRDDGAWSR